MAVPVPALHSASTVLTTAETTTWYNTMQWLLAPPKCRLVTTTVTTLTTAFTWYSVAFDSESYDLTNMHDNATNNSRITIATAGYYRITGKLQSLATIGARLAISGTADATTETWAQLATGAYANPKVDTTLYLTVGQYIEIQGDATVGGTNLVPAGCYLEAHWVSN